MYWNATRQETPPCFKVAFHFFPGALKSSRLLASQGKLDEAVPAGKHVHDANTVATMLAHDVPNLLTYNTGNFSRYSQLINVSSL